MTIPHWPGMMTKRTALAYLDLTEVQFAREIAAGRLPDSVLFGDKPHWYKEALDKALAVIAGERAPDEAITKFRERIARKRAA